MEKCIYTYKLPWHGLLGLGRFKDWPSSCLGATGFGPDMTGQMAPAP